MGNILKPIFKTRTTMQWQERFRAAGALFGPIWTLDDLFGHPHVTQRGVVQELQHPTLGPINQFGPVVWLSDTPGAVQGPPPLLGQHTEDVLRELGYGAEQIRGLEGEGVIQTCLAQSPTLRN